MNQKFYVLRDKLLSHHGLVQHISITAFGSLVITTSEWLNAMLFSYEDAVRFRDYLEGHNHNCVGYEIVSLDDL